MTFRLRYALPLVCAGILGAVFLMAMQSHAHASNRQLSFSRLNKIQKRIISETLASAIGAPASSSSGHFAPIGGDDGGGPDGAPFTPPKSYGAAGATGSPTTYFPASQGTCSARRGNNVKVNQNCLNVSDPDLQGRGQVFQKNHRERLAFLLRELLVHLNNRAADAK